MSAQPIRTSAIRMLNVVIKLAATNVNVPMGLWATVLFAAILTSACVHPAISTENVLIHREVSNVRVTTVILEMDFLALMKMNANLTWTIARRMDIAKTRLDHTSAFACLDFPGTVLSVLTSTSVTTDYTLVIPTQCVSIVLVTTTANVILAFLATELVATILTNVLLPPTTARNTQLVQIPLAHSAARATMDIVAMGLYALT
jgi:hypothetical protein